MKGQGRDKMIHYFNQIKNFGIYRSCSKDASLDPFHKYNLFYGWNGSGKSTLSRVFNVLEKKAIPTEFSNCEFKVTLQNGINITNNNLDDFPYNLFVFNQEFINENINWNESLKSLLLISEERIGDHNRLQQLVDDRMNLIKEDTQHQLIIDKDKKEIDSFLSATAKKIKLHFQVIDTSDRYYFNYNRARLEDIISSPQSTGYKVLSEDEVQKITKSIQPNTKDIISLEINKIPIESYHEGRKRLEKLTQTNIVTFSIDRLKEHSDINKWVENGIQIHKDHHSSICEFCGQALPEKRMQELSNHFNDTYKEFIDRLNNAHNWLNERKINYELPSVSDLYDEFKEDYSQNVSELLNITQKINGLVESWVVSVGDKIKEPFRVDFVLKNFDEGLFSNYNQIVEKVDEIVQKHNNKTINFKSETDRLKKILEFHFMLKSIDEFKFLTRQAKIRKLLEKKREISISLKIKNDEINHLESQLSNEVFGASIFNEQIHNFLGHKELSLRFDDRNKGYRIIRNNRIAKNLSEGEKTAIAFVYFIVKLKENGNRISDSIIVVDDPISSFDSNNLFHAYSFLKNEFQDALQLFVLTHNFVFYKLLRDWLCFREIKKKTSFYTIESRHINDERESYFKNTSSALLNYNSEYHYIFSKTYEYKDKSELNIDEAFLVSNLCRKLLESFLCFKFPKKRGSFHQLVNDAITDRTKREKIYKFINKYSHNEVIEFDDNTIDNLLAESSNIVSEVLEIIKDLDSNHFIELENVVNESRTG